MFSGIIGSSSPLFEIAPHRGLAGPARIADTPYASEMALDLVHGSRTRPWGTICCPGSAAQRPVSLIQNAISVIMNGRFRVVPVSWTLVVVLLMHGVCQEGKTSARGGQRTLPDGAREGDGVYPGRVG